MIQDDIKNILEGLPLAVAKELDTIGEEMVNDMKHRLIAGGHTDFGTLVDSIHADTTATKDEVITDVCIDAKTDEKNVWYAQFIEFGTGKFNEDHDGRQTPWVWFPKPGSKYYRTHTTKGGKEVVDAYTTKGQKPDPFIRPTVAAHEGELNERMSLVMGDLKRYKK